MSVMPNQGTKVVPFFMYLSDLIKTCDKSQSGCPASRVLIGAHFRFLFWSLGLRGGLSRVKIDSSF